MPRKTVSFATLVVLLAPIGLDTAASQSATLEPFAVIPAADPELRRLAMASHERSRTMRARFQRLRTVTVQSSAHVTYEMSAASIQAAASDSDVPASCHFDDLEGRGRSRLKLMDRTAYELAREGCRSSATFRGLVRRIEELRGFVYVTSRVKLRATTEGVLQHSIQLTPDGSRCLWIVVKRDRLSFYRVGVLGHELQHALEVLENPDVRSSDDIERLFRGQRQTNDGQILETDAALAAGDRVVSELAKRQRRQ